MPGPARGTAGSAIIRAGARMHGLIHIELERFVRSTLGDAVWDEAAAAAGVSQITYVADRQYGDAELLAVVIAISKATGAGPQSLLEQFGRALVPSLIAAHRHLVHPEWRTIELIANTEALIHTTLRAGDAAAQPPMLRTTKRGPHALLVIYASERRMCGVAKGIMRGVADHYGETIVVTEESCMLTGDGTCNLAVVREAG